MSVEIIDTTLESIEAEIASNIIDYKRQFNIPDFEKLLKSAYYHGYRDALITIKHPELRNQ